MAQPKRNYQPAKTTPPVVQPKDAKATTVPGVKPAMGTTIPNRKTVIVRQPLPSLFTKDNYLWMAIGAGVVILGMLLMMGGKNENPEMFDTKLVYSTTRITIAPILILAGLMIEVYAIFKNPKATVVTKE